MYTIQTNVSGTRSMEISEEHLKTIQKYALFQQLIDSNGIVDESVLDLNYDGTFNVEDSTMIMKYVVGIPVSSG